MPTKTGRLNMTFAIAIIFFLFLILSGPRPVSALSPGVQVPEWVRARPILRGVPLPGGEIEAGFEVTALLGQFSVLSAILVDGEGRTITSATWAAVDRQSPLRILGKAVMPQGRGEYTFRLKALTEIPRIPILEKLRTDYPAALVEEFLASKALGTTVELDYGASISVFETEAFMGMDGTSFIGRAHSAVDGNRFYLVRDFRIGVTLADTQAEIDRFRTLRRVLEETPDITGSLPGTDAHGYVIALCGLATEALLAGRRPEAVTGFREAAAEASNFLPDDIVTRLSIANSLVVAQSLLSEAGDGPRKALFDALCEEGEALESNRGLTSNLRTMGAYFKYNRAVAALLRGDGPYASAGLTEAIRIRPWLFAAMDILRGLPARPVSGSDESREGWARPDVSGDGFSAEARNRKKSVFKDSGAMPGYFFPIIAALIIFFVLLAVKFFSRDR